MEMNFQMRNNMRQTIVRTGSIIVIFAVAVGVMSTPTLAAKQTKTAAPRPPKASKLPPNIAGGVVKGINAKPVSGVTVDIWGTVSANGGIVNFDPTTNAAGRYRQTAMPPGIYTVRAWKVIRYNGKNYKLPMSPVQGKIEDQYLSKNGIARDFVWKISGPIPSKFFDPDEPNSYYGGSLTILGTDQLANRLVLPDNTILNGKLVPDGPLIDGSIGRTISFKFPFKSGELYQTVHKDIPLGRYTLTLSAFLPSGETKAIKLYDGSGYEESDFKDTKLVEFMPGGAAVRPFQTHFINGVSVSVKL